MKRRRAVVPGELRQDVITAELTQLGDVHQFYWLAVSATRHSLPLTEQSDRDGGCTGCSLTMLAVMVQEAGGLGVDMRMPVLDTDGVAVLSQPDSQGSRS